MRGVWLKGDFFAEFLNYLQILPILILKSALDEILYVMKLKIVFHCIWILNLSF